MVRASRNLIIVDELESLLGEQQSAKGEINTLAELAWELRISQPERSKVFATKAISQAQSGEFTVYLYKEGFAAGLVVLAFLHLQIGELEEGMNKAIDALKALRNSADSKVSARVWHILSHGSFFFGDFPTAMEQAQRALNLASEHDLLIDKAWNLDVLASIYGVLGDFDNAMQAHAEAADIFKRQNDIDGILRSGNNLAMTLAGKKEYEKALEETQRVLEIARERKRKYDRLNICCTAAQISIDMGLLMQAEEYLHESFSNAEILENTITYHVFVIMEWARLSLKKGNIQESKSHLLQAIVLAEENDQLAELSQCYERLVYIYEQEGLEEEALRYSKEFEYFKKEVEKKLEKNRLAIQVAIVESENQI